MSNSGAYYNHGTFPTTGAAGSSATMRSELDAIETGLNKLPTMAANGNKLVKVASSADNLEVSSVISDDGTDATIAGDLIVSGTQIGQNGTQKHIIPAVASDTIALLAATQTLTGKTVNLTNNTLTGTTAQFNTALSDGDFATQAGTETLTNKTIVAASNTITTAASGNLAATSLNAALAELQSDIDTRALDSAVVHKTGDETVAGVKSFSGNMVFSGTAQRIIGDFSNATVASRVMFQTSTVNGATTVSFVPNGTDSSANILLHNASDPNNSAVAQFGMANTGQEARVASGITGVGAYKPMTFYAGGLERMRINVSGNVLVTSPAGLGYGAGAGGTVTQATNKSTAVTLNKPTGQITMNAEALAAGAEVFFALNNSLIADTDVVIVTVNWNPAAAYTARVYFTGTGTANIGVKNITAGSLFDAVVINFAILKGAVS